MYIKNIIRFIVLILLQVLVLNQINFYGYVDPYFYVLFILTLPFETPGWLLLISSFLLGLGVDVFSGTAGIHAAASTFMAFVRPGIIRFLTSETELESGMEPGTRDMGFQWFLLYSIIMIFLHHLALFFLEVFSLVGIINTFLRILINSILTLILVIISQYLFYRKK
jgi:rod shape-determining protein MreD